MKARYAVLAGIAALATSATVSAAQADYYLKIDTVEGEAMASDWSFGACNAGQCATISSPRDAASGQATGKRQHEPIRPTASQNTQSLRESPTRPSSGNAGWDLATGKGARTAGGVTVAAGDVDGSRLGPKPHPAASTARVVAAVAREEHAVLHLVAALFEVLEEAAYAVPIPAIALEDELAVLANVNQLTDALASTAADPAAAKRMQL